MAISGSYNYPGVYGDNPSKQGLVKTTQYVQHFSNSAVFLGDNYAVVYGPQDLSQFNVISVSLLNNSSNSLKSGTIEWSPDNINWEVVDSGTFFNLAGSTLKSTQIVDNCRRYMRVRAWTSGSGGALTGNLDVYVTVK